MTYFNTDLKNLRVSMNADKSVLWACVIIGVILGFMDWVYWL